LAIALAPPVRADELRGAEWSEFNIEGAEWRVPAERMKMGVEHSVAIRSHVASTFSPDHASAPALS
jgi:integrase